MSICELKERSDVLYGKIMEMKNELERLVDEYEFVQCKIQDEKKRLENEPAPESKYELTPNPKDETESDTETDDLDKLPDRYKQCKNMEAMLNLLSTEMKQLEETAKTDFKMDDLTDNEAILKRMADARASLYALRGSKE